MNSGQPPLPRKIQVNPSCWILRPTLQLKIIQANSSVESFCLILRPTLQLKTKANSLNEFRPSPPHQKIQVNPSAEF